MTNKKREKLYEQLILACIEDRTEMWENVLTDPDIKELFLQFPEDIKKIYEDYGFPKELRKAFNDAMEEPQMSLLMAS